MPLHEPPHPAPEADPLESGPHPAHDDLGDGVVFNGIDAATGAYLVENVPVDQASLLALGQQLDAGYLAELRDRHGDPMKARLGVKAGIDPTDLGESGWGIVFAREDGDRTERIEERLAPLLQVRREQAGKRYRQLEGAAAYRRGESKNGYLERLGAGGGGPCDPEILPYYLLIAASPEAIPYSFEFQLSVQYAVGRIHFDELDDYRRYAEAVVAAEDHEITRSRTAVFFGVRNRGDLATRLSARGLVEPLARTLEEEQPGWRVDRCLGDDATKESLRRILCDDDLPALVFTASHGLGLGYDGCRPGSDQGALVCTDWPGPIAGAGQPIRPEHYFAGVDVDGLGDDSRVHGVIGFHFACFGAGTPRRDSFTAEVGADAFVAERPFVAHLPQRLLASPSGGALACVGHVDRAIPASFRWRGGGVQLGVFESALERLATGHPVGSAMEFFPERFAEITVDLDAQRSAVRMGEKDPDKRLLAGLWSAQMDARSYVIVGDPAVRLAVD